LRGSSSVRHSDRRVLSDAPFSCRRPPAGYRPPLLPTQRSPKPPGPHSKEELPRERGRTTTPREELPRTGAALVGPAGNCSPRKGLWELGAWPPGTGRGLGAQGRQCRSRCWVSVLVSLNRGERHSWPSPACSSCLPPANRPAAPTCPLPEEQTHFNMEEGRLGQGRSLLKRKVVAAPCLATPRQSRIWLSAFPAESHTREPSSARDLRCACAGPVSGASARGLSLPW
jgi:hypothetical protein